MEYENDNQIFKKALARLTERAKELNCLYHLEELLRTSECNPDHLFRQLTELIPPGWQYPTVCEVRIVFEGKEYVSEDFRETPWSMKADLEVDNNVAGYIEVVYTQLINLNGDTQFLPEEQRLLNTIASRVSGHIFSRRLRKSMRVLESPGIRIPKKESILKPESDAHWKWRYQMSELYASELDCSRFGVKAVYLIGSTKNASSGPGSDIDLMIHFAGTADQLRELKAWTEGWSLCLSEMNFQKTGYRTHGLIDLHIITDEDIAKKTSFAIMIQDPSNKARLLKNAAPDA